MKHILTLFNIFQAYYPSHSPWNLKYRITTVNRKWPCDNIPNHKAECTNSIWNNNNVFFIVKLLIHRFVNMYHNIEIWFIDWYIWWLLLWYTCQLLFTLFGAPPTGAIGQNWLQASSRTLWTTLSGKPSSLSPQKYACSSSMPTALPRASEWDTEILKS